MTEKNPQNVKPGDGSDNVEDLTKQLNEANAKLEAAGVDNAAKDDLILSIKKAQQGSDAKVTELSEKLKASLTDTEKEKLELTELKDMVKQQTGIIEEMKTSQATKDLKSFKLETMAAKKVDLSFADNIFGGTEEDIIKNIDSFKSTLDEKMKAGLVAIIDGDDPEGGNRDIGKDKMKRTDFDNLSDEAQTAEMEKGTKLID